MSNVGLFAAFVAGVLSISSPCVLPLLPLYLAHLVGVGTDGAVPSRRVVLPHALAFVVGFGLIFVLLGVSLGALGGVFLAYRDWIVRAGGAFMVLMGLHLLGVLRMPLLEREHRIPVPGAGAHPVRSGTLFAAYAAGLAVPFLAVALALGGISRPLRKVSAGLSVGSGAVLTAVGVLMLLGLYQQIFARIVGMAPWTPWEPTL